MELNDIVISKAIIDKFSKKFMDYLDVDVAIVGAGPSGLTASYYLAKAHKKVAIFERKLSIGGGMWGGGMMFNEIVVQKDGKTILDEFGINTEEYQPNYYTADAIQAVCTICAAATKAGVKIFNLISIEDVMVREERVVGLVINWTAVNMANLHVDPLSIKAKYIIEATGHATEVAEVIQRKVGDKILTKTGTILGEKSMWADKGEQSIPENTRELYPGVYAAGMAANAIFGGHRMGPIFGGMLLSGKKAAEMIISRDQKLGAKD